MKNLFIILFMVLGTSYAQTYTTIADNTWSTDGTTDCGCAPGFNDEIVINHFADMPPGTYRGPIFVNGGGTFYVNGNLITGRFLRFDFLVFQGGELEVTGNYVNYSIVSGDGGIETGGSSVNYGIFPDVRFGSSIPDGEFNGGVLPVELISFEASNAEEGVYLEWITATEINNDRFSIERSEDLQEFIEVGVVYGNGTTNQVSSYEFVDSYDVQNKEYYYRLKQFDYNGNFEYSKIISINVTISYMDNIYPNSSSGVFNVDIENIKSVIVMDTEGDVVLEQEVADGGAFQIDITSQKSGVYFVKAITLSGNLTTAKIVKL